GRAVGRSVPRTIRGSDDGSRSARSAQPTHCLSLTPIRSFPALGAFRRGRACRNGRVHGRTHAAVIGTPRSGNFYPASTVVPTRQGLRSRACPTPADGDLHPMKKKTLWIIIGAVLVVGAGGAAAVRGRGHKPLEVQTAKVG